MLTKINKCLKRIVHLLGADFLGLYKISSHCCERPRIAAQMHTWFSSMRSWLTSPWLQSCSPALTDAIASTFVGTLSVLHFSLHSPLSGSTWILSSYLLALSSAAFCSVSACSARSMAFSLSSLSICIFFLMASMVAGWSSVWVKYEFKGATNEVQFLVLQRKCGQTNGCEEI